MCIYIYIHMYTYTGCSPTRTMAMGNTSRSLRVRARLPRRSEAPTLSLLNLEPCAPHSNPNTCPLTPNPKALAWRLSTIWPC